MNFCASTCNYTWARIANILFYISGESYAGIYVPMLAEQIMAQKLIPNFMGVLVGDGVTDYRFDTYATGALPFAYGHNIIDKGLYDDSIDACVTNINQTKCDSLENKFQTLVSGLDIYGIYLDCFNRPKTKCDRQGNFAIVRSAGRVFRTPAVANSDVFGACFCRFPHVCLS